VTCRIVCAVLSRKVTGTLVRTTSVRIHVHNCVFVFEGTQVLLGYMHACSCSNDRVMALFILVTSVRSVVIYGICKEYANK